MVEEKARSLLPRQHFASMSYYIAEYGARGMTIDAFVAVLLEMLDTPEKVFKQIFQYKHKTTTTKKLLIISFKYNFSIP